MTALPPSRYWAGSLVSASATRQRDTLAIEFIAQHYPTLPGCYLMKDARGQVIYVGKAKNLRKRLASYFQPSRKSGRTSRMAARIADIEVIIVNNEIESLVLENNLIKRYKPRYNRMLKWDGSGYYYIVLTDEAVPRFLPYRKNRFNKALEKVQGVGIQQRFGPYISYKYRNRLIDHVNETFQARTCVELPGKVCLRFHMHRCSGICEGMVTREAYEASMSQAVDFLIGSHDEVIYAMRQQMAEAADNLEFERAQRIKEHIKILESTLASQVVERNTDHNQDIIFFGDVSGISGRGASRHDPGDAIGRVGCR